MSDQEQELTQPQPLTNPQSTVYEAFAILQDALEQDANYMGTQISQLILAGCDEEARSVVSHIQNLRHIKVLVAKVETHHRNSKHAIRTQSPPPQDDPVPPVEEEPPAATESLPIEADADRGREVDDRPDLAVVNWRGPSSPQTDSRGRRMIASYIFPVMKLLYAHGPLTQHLLMHHLREDFPHFAEPIGDDKERFMAQLRTHLIKNGYIHDQRRHWVMTHDGKNFVQGK